MLSNYLFLQWINEIVVPHLLIFYPACFNIVVPLNELFLYTI